MTEEEKKLLQEQQGQNAQNSQPSYSSAWQSELEDTWKKIQNRPDFQYDVNADALWNQYKDQYVRQGQMAMMDTMGQAQAMTGGYGNSYAQTVGQQAYQGYLQGLNDKLPQFYQMAQDQHKAEGDQLLTEYGILSDLEGKDYSRWMDEQAQRNWQTEWDEYIRRYNYENGLGEFATQGSGFVEEEKKTSQIPDVSDSNKEAMDFVDRMLAGSTSSKSNPERIVNSTSALNTEQKAVAQEYLSKLLPQHLQQLLQKLQPFSN
jgi:hypothetical protein